MPEQIGVEWGGMVRGLVEYAKWTLPLTRTLALTLALTTTLP